MKQELLEKFLKESDSILWEKLPEKIQCELKENPTKYFMKLLTNCNSRSDIYEDLANLAQQENGCTDLSLQYFGMARAFSRVCDLLHGYKLVPKD